MIHHATQSIINDWVAFRIKNLDDALLQCNILFDSVSTKKYTHKFASHNYIARKMLQYGKNDKYMIPFLERRQKNIEHRKFEKDGFHTAGAYMYVKNGNVVMHLFTYQQVKEPYNKLYRFITGNPYGITYELDYCIIVCSNPYELIIL